MPASASRHWPAWLALEASSGRLGDIPPAVWPEVLTEAAAQDLLPALHRAVMDAGSVDLPVPVAQTLELAHRKATLAAFGWRRALQRVLPALADAGVEAVPYKGAAIAFGLLDDPATRPMSDIDLWVDEASMPRASKVFEAMGFERRDGRADRPPAWQIRVDGEVPYSGRRLGIPLVELHYGVFPGEWLHRVARIDRAGVRARLQPLTVAGVATRVLEPEDHFIQVALHAVVSHQLNDAPLRALRDLLILARDRFDWNRMVDRARAWNVSAPVALACACAGESFERQEFDAAAAALASPSRLQALRRLANAATLRAGPRESSAWQHWRFLLALAPRRRDALRLVQRAMWPEEDWLQARYGRRGVSARARHLAGALRGRF